MVQMAWPKEYICKIKETQIFVEDLNLFKNEPGKNYF